MLPTSQQMTERAEKWFQAMRLPKNVYLREKALGAEQTGRQFAAILEKDGRTFEIARLLLYSDGSIAASSDRREYYRVTGILDRD